MLNIPTENEVIPRLIAWGEKHPTVRAMIMTSTRTVPNAKLDILSDYDVILVLTDIHPFHESREWLEAFGRVLALYRDPIQTKNGFESSGYVVQFEDGLKIDFTLMPVAQMQHIAAAPNLPDEFDAGYRVLLDKDGLTTALQPPTYKAYIPKPPTEAQYLEKVELFFHEATYVAKYLWRDDLIAAKYVFENFMKLSNLIPMLEWRMEVDHQWTVKPGPYGRGLKRWLRPDLWTELEATYVGADIAANWEAMWKTIDLFQKAAVEVADLMGFTYPHELHQRAVNYLRNVQKLTNEGDK